MPSLSIIVPVYNMAPYLHLCIDSILKQTYENFELILINDGSTDSSGQICDDYSKRDSRIIVYHKENGGLSSVRNMGLEIAKGDFVGFVDSDDSIMPDMYQLLMEAVTRTASDIGVCGRNNVNEVSGEFNPLFVFDKEVIWDSVEALRRYLLWEGLDASVCDKVIARKIFEDLRFPSGYIGEDVAITYQLISRANSVVHVGVPLYNYLQRAGSMSKSKYSETAKGMIYYHKAAYHYCKTHYPMLIREAEAYYFHGVKALIVRYVGTDTWQDVDWINNEALECLRIVWRNRAITTKSKVGVFLFSFNIIKKVFRKFAK